MTDLPTGQLGRIEQSLLQRTRPDAIGPAYNRTPAGRPPVPPPDMESFWAKITGSTPVNGSGTGHATDPSTQWTYSFIEVHKTARGYGGWSVLSGARSGSNNAYNSIEDINTDKDDGDPPHLQGNGVVLEHLDYDGDDTYEFALQPVPDNVPVRMHVVRFMVGVTEHTEYWFTPTNGVDGECG